MAGELSGVLQARITLPNTEQPTPGIPGSRLTVFLLATPPIIGVLRPGDTNRDFVVAGTTPVTLADRPRPSRLLVYKLASGLTNQVLVSGLVHARGLGAALVHPQVRLAGLQQARALGVPTTVPSVVPPVEPPPVTPPSVPPTQPRTLRGVRRRNIVEERD